MQTFAHAASSTVEANPMAVEIAPVTETQHDQVCFTTVRDEPRAFSLKRESGGIPHPDEL